jgi:hypothetical protein
MRTIAPQGKRPVAVTLVGGLFIAAGIVGLAYHVTDIDTSGPFRLEAVWILLLRLLATVGGVFVLRGRNWARWLVVAWMAYHVALSAWHSPVEIAVHAMLLVLIAYVLFRKQSAAFFQTG